ncbi:hypothetical protein BJF78_31275 [Pseudonocardia sp. CNS-139]|nr:hypothetical protein BJF78_31275 [Pseudonocardia sp. CNS-139]
MIGRAREPRVSGRAGRTSLSQQAAEWMQHQIRDGAWPLNSRIPTEMELAELLGVGRSTVREATQSLVKTGMLEAAPGRGTFVRSRNAVNTVLSEYLAHQPLADLLGLRRALEVEAAGLAAERRTDADLVRLQRALTLAEHQHAGLDLPEGSGGSHGMDPTPTPGSFHADVFTAARNELLTEMYQAAIVVVRRAVHAGQLVAAPASERDEDHQRIYEAIAAADPEAARAAAADHADRDFLPAAGNPSPSGRLADVTATALAATRG